MKDSILTYIGEMECEVVVYSVERHSRCSAMESVYDLGGVSIDYEVLDLDGNELTLSQDQAERIESELQEIYA